MQHSIKQMAEEHAKLSNMRFDDPRFNAEEFIKFAKDRKDKYSIVEENGDLTIGTWNSDVLLKDYKNLLEERKRKKQQERDDEDQRQRDAANLALMAATLSMNVACM